MAVFTEISPETDKGGFGEANSITQKCMLQVFIPPLRCSAYHVLMQAHVNAQIQENQGRLNSVKVMQAFRLLRPMVLELFSTSNTLENTVTMKTDIKKVVLAFKLDF